MFSYCFGLLTIFYWRQARIIAVDYAVLGGWRRNFVVFPHFGQACVVAYLTLEMRSDYAKVWTSILSPTQLNYAIVKGIHVAWK